MGAYVIVPRNAQNVTGSGRGEPVARPFTSVARPFTSVARPFTSVGCPFTSVARPCTAVVARVRPWATSRYCVQFGRATGSPLHPDFPLFAVRCSLLVYVDNSPPPAP